MFISLLYQLGVVPSEHPVVRVFGFVVLSATGFHLSKSVCKQLCQLVLPFTGAERLAFIRLEVDRTDAGS